MYCKCRPLGFPLLVVGAKRTLSCNNFEPWLPMVEPYTPLDFGPLTPMSPKPYTLNPKPYFLRSARRLRLSRSSTEGPILTNVPISYYLLKNPPKHRKNNPDITLLRTVFFFFFWGGGGGRDLKQLVVSPNGCWKRPPGALRRGLFRV